MFSLISLYYPFWELKDLKIWGKFQNVICPWEVMKKASWNVLVLQLFPASKVTSQLLWNQVRRLLANSRPWCPNQTTTISRRKLWLCISVRVGTVQRDAVRETMFFKVSTVSKEYNSECGKLCVCSCTSRCLSGSRWSVEIRCQPVQDPLHTSLGWNLITTQIIINHNCWKHTLSHKDIHTPEGTVGCKERNLWGGGLNHTTQIILLAQKKPGRIEPGNSHRTAPCVPCTLAHYQKKL